MNKKSTIPAKITPELNINPKMKTSNLPKKATSIVDKRSEPAIPVRIQEYAATRI
ncbi:MAG: hypothetical protein HY363_04955 [Candidatus Aenigmarchaeota archaeon]|nr:hypothetical protein [Candidatus Aenigmarchaeota archaeon]